MTTAEPGAAAAGPPARRYVDAHGHPVNEAGAVLTGVRPWDSEAFSEFCRRESLILQHPGTEPSAMSVDGADRRDLVALIEAMTDAGEIEEARARLAELERVFSDAPAYSPAFVEASRLRREALMLPGSRPDRAATTRTALVRVQELAGAVTGPETAAVRRMIAELGRELRALEADTPDGRP